THKSIAWPVDYVVTTLRALKVKLKGRDMVVAGGDFTPIYDHLQSMGQTLFDPPSVFGWDWQNSWISSATLLARYDFVREVVMAGRDGGGTSSRREKLVDVTLTDADAIVAAVLKVCGVGDLFDATEKDALAAYLTDGAGPIDLLDDGYRNQKLNGLFALVLTS